MRRTVVLGLIKSSIGFSTRTDHELLQKAGAREEDLSPLETLQQMLDSLAQDESTELNSEVHPHKRGHKSV
jgi:hypothetical protein